MNKNILSYYSLYPYNIESPQGMEIQWSVGIGITANDDLPTVDDSRFKWESAFVPHVYNESTEEYEPHHMWMKFKVGKEGVWQGPVKLFDSKIVKGEQGERGEKGDYGLRGVQGNDGKGIRVKYADELFNEVSGTSPSMIYINIRKDGESWIGWKKLVGSDGVGTGGTGMPPGGTAGQLIERTGGGTSWIDPISILDSTLSATLPLVYTNGDVSHDNTDGNKHIPAGGSNGQLLGKVGGVDTWVEDLDILSGLTADSPIIYDSLTGVISHGVGDGEKHIPAGGTEDDIITFDSIGNPIILDRGTLLDDISAVSPIVYNSTTNEISHDGGDGNKHVPHDITSGALLTPDGTGDFTWNLFLDDTGVSGDTDKLLSAAEIESRLRSISGYRIKDVVASSSDLSSIISPIANQLAIVKDENTVYRYNGNWLSYYKLDDIDYINNYFTLSSDLVDVAGNNDLVDWSVISNIPTMLHDDTSNASSSTTENKSVYSVIDLDEYGHVTGVDKRELEERSLVKGEGIFMEEQTGFPVNEYKPLSETNVYMKVDYIGIGNNYGNSQEAARGNHKHDKDTLNIEGIFNSTDDILLSSTDDLNNLIETSLYLIDGNSLPSNMPSDSTLLSGGIGDYLNPASKLYIKVIKLRSGGGGVSNIYQEIGFKKGILAKRYRNNGGIWSSWKSNWSSSNDIVEGTRECSVISPKVHQTHGSWQTPTYEGNWSAWSPSPLRFRKMNDGTVKIQGNFGCSTSNGTTTVFTLPEGYRPSRLEFIYAKKGTLMITGSITTDGIVSFAEDTSSYFIIDTTICTD